MFLEFYGLREQPFGVTPDPRYLFLSPSHREALASLFYTIETKRGFSALVAEPGMGKTSLIFRLMETLKSSTRTAFLFQSQGDSRAFLRSILNDAGVSCNGEEDVPRMHEMLNQVLIEEAHLGRHFVLIVDEAQNLDDEVLESVRLLSNFETTTAKLMHIVLAGQPALSDKLERPELVQLKQRVSSVIQLSPFSLQETAEYIDHRLHVAGYRGIRPFTREAVKLIHRYSDGIPRNINSLCFQAFSLGFASQIKVIDVDILREALADQGIETPVSQASRPEWSIPNLPDPGYSYASEAYGSRSQGRPRLIILGLLVLPILFLVFFSSPLLSETIPGKFTIRILSAVVGVASGSSSDDFPRLPARLGPPSPPAIVETKDTDPSTEEDVTTSNNANTNDAKAELNQKTIHSFQQRKRPVRAVEKKTPGPRVVWARRKETIFQVALEYYGKSDWTIVRDIRSANPQIRDPYEVIREGQRIVLPDLPSRHP